MLIDKNDAVEYADYTVMMRKDGYYTGYYGRTTPNQFENDVINRLGNSLKEAQAFSIDFYGNENFNHTIASSLYDKIDLLFERGTSSFYNTHFDNNLPDGAFEYEIILSGLKSKKVN